MYSKSFTLPFLHITVLLSVVLIYRLDIIECLNLLNVTPGYQHVCALFDNNKAKCFGNGSVLGVATSSTKIGDDPSEIGNHAPFIEFSTTSNITKLVLGGTTTCVQLNTNDFKCIGENYAGQVGLGISDSIVGKLNGYIGDSLPTINFGAGLKVIQFALGYDHSCALLTGNKVKCFGYGGDAQLGYENDGNIGNGVNDMGDNLPFVNLGTNVEIETIWLHSASESTCVTLSAPASASQRLKCWGLNDRGQLGFGTRSIGDQVGDMGDNLPLLSFGLESRVASVSSGYRHTCVQLINNEIRCFGWNLFNQLAIGIPSVTSIKASENTIAVSIEAGKSIKAFGCGDVITCFLYDDQLTVKCMGLNENGDLGAGNSINTPLNATLPNVNPIELGIGNIKIKNIYINGLFNCVEFENKEFKCFGYNHYGNFGIGNANNIGDDPYEMGVNLTSSVFYVETNAPSKSPSSSPSITPSKTPTNAPKLPTNVPTRAPTKNPTDSPSGKPAITQTGQSNPNNLALSIGLGVSIPFVVLAVGVGIGFIRSKKNTGKQESKNTNDQSITIKTN